MEDKEILELQIRLRNGDETEKIEAMEKTLEWLFKSSNPEHRDLLNEEYSRFANLIDESLKSEIQG